jgi:hypothetical protein
VLLASQQSQAVLVEAKAAVVMEHKLLLGVKPTVMVEPKLLVEAKVAAIKREPFCREF